MSSSFIPSQVSSTKSSLTSIRVDPATLPPRRPAPTVPLPPLPPQAVLSPKSPGTYSDPPAYLSYDAVHTRISAGFMSPKEPACPPNTIDDKYHRYMNLMDPSRTHQINKAAYNVPIHHGEDTWTEARWQRFLSEPYKVPADLPNPIPQPDFVRREMIAAEELQWLVKECHKTHPSRYGYNNKLADDFEYRSHSARRHDQNYKRHRRN